MALPSWPSINDISLKDGFQYKPWSLKPIITEMEGGNVRVRQRPGYRVASVTQTIRFKAAELAVFRSFFETTLGGGAGRFKMNVWTGTSYENKVCQFDLNTAPQFNYVSPNDTYVSMQLWVYS